MRFSRAIAVCLMAGMPGVVHAQAWIGTMVGNMVAQQREAQMEAACRAGTPASDKNIAWATTSSEAAMANYLTLDTKSGDSQLRKVFAINKADASWKGPEGSVALADLPKHLDGAKPSLTKMSFVVAGDATSARGVWQANWPDNPDRHAWYAVDFTGQPQTMWGSGKFRVWHMTVFAGDKQPNPPAAYCHFDPDQAW